MNHKRVERIWQREGLKVPPKQKKRSRLWLNDGSCIRLRPKRPNHVWSYDFVQDRTADGRAYRKPNSTDVLDALTNLFICAARPNTSAVTTALNLLPRRSATGLQLLDQRPPTSRRVHLGRTDTAKTSMPGSGTNCSTESCSTRSRRQGSSSKIGENTTTPSGHTAH